MKIKIDNIAYGGYGVGRADGKAIFVDYAVPGDELIIEVYDDRKSYAFARIKEILNPSHSRTVSPCPNFEICGGCSYLNLNYTDEIYYKTKILRDQLERIASVKPDFDIKTITGERFHYRSHSNIKCNGTIAGFYGKSSNEIISFPENGCLLISPILIDGLKSLDISGINGDLKIAEDWKGGFYSGINNDLIIEEKTGEYYYRRSVNGFFQSNKYLREKMVETVCNYSGLSSNDEFADICAGCGFFTIPLSKIASRGTGYDIDKVSMEFAALNAELNNCTNIKFFPLSESEINPFRINSRTVVVDPPRAGLSKKGRRTINTINPEIIVYVSCNPSTFSRDLIDFMKNGYQLDDISLIDMFACTHHIEIISRLVKTHR